MARDRSSSDEGASVLALWQGRSQGSVPWRERCSLSSGGSRVRRGEVPAVVTPSERTVCGRSLLWGVDVVVQMPAGRPCEGLNSYIQGRYDRV